MKHADITFDGSRIEVHVDPTGNTPALRALEPPAEFDPLQPWAVLGTKDYNFQYGWNPGGFISLPFGAWIWIEQLDSPPELEVYQRPPASPGYEPIFGTGGSPTRWKWPGSMTHNVYAVQDPTASRYEAIYRVYIADEETGDPLDGYQSGEVSFLFKAITPADFDEDYDVDVDDLVTWKDGFGVDMSADADQDGDSDGADFLAWQRQYYVDEAAVSVGNAPEPSTIALAMLFAPCVFQARRRPGGGGSRRAVRH